MAWIPHIGYLLGRSGRTLWSWSGFGWAAIFVSLLVFICTLWTKAAEGYRQRHSRFSPGGIMKETLHALRPTLASWPTRIALGAWALLFTVAIIVTVYQDHIGLVEENRKLRSQLQAQKDNASLYPLFVRTRDLHADALGSIVAKAESIVGLQAEYEKAWILRSDTSPFSFFVRLQEKNKTWAEMGAGEPSGQDYKWWNEKWLRDHFHPPEDRCPPYASVAYQWDLDETLKPLIGWRIWQRTFPMAHIQRFTLGKIVGPFLRRPSHDMTGMTFVLFNNHTWETGDTEASPPVNERAYLPQTVSGGSCPVEAKLFAYH